MLQYPLTFHLSATSVTIFFFTSNSLLEIEGDYKTVPVQIGHYSKGQPTFSYSGSKFFSSEAK